ncbi:MAG: bifunctional protein-serine/threonine kinase/phosphatase, partial [Gammaproteobacteria bacterium]|nr:bifunctional protein-serine/threonine kinase/phosphatase [Gammaproteobacteria bacterium]
MTEKLQIALAQSSDKGVKAQNEDFYGAYLSDDSTLDSKGIACAIADGMGSCANAREASEHCVKSFLSDYFSTPETWSVKSSGAKVLTAINNWLLSNGDKDHSNGMVTTFSALVLKSTTAHIFHIGDSRIYRYRPTGKNGDFEQLTTDHRVWISNEKNYLSRAMGIDLHLDIDYKTLAIEVDDVFIMTTDGVHDYLSDAQLKQHVQSSASIDVIADKIIKHALEEKSHDNVTCQLVRIEQLPNQDANEVFNDLTRLPFPPPMGPGMTIDGYEILDEIHASATSQLYKVRDTESGKLFMMKTPSVNYSDDPAYIERFYIEEWAGKRIDNDSVLHIYEQKRPRNFLYFIMELIEGKTLKQWMQENPLPDIHEATELINKIIQGLRAFHRMEMLHRDLKPENIMLTKDGNIKIIDFGSVKIAGIQEINTPVERMELLGTKNYTAPEYLLGTEGSNRSDIYSLGVIAYEIFTGELPYGDKLSRDLNWRTLNKIKYHSAIQHNPMIPLWLDGALEKAVKTDYRSRYDTFSEFFFDLTHPNATFMKHSAPLLESNPTLLWKSISAILLAGNIIFL